MASINLQLDKLKARSNSGKVYFTFEDIQGIPEWPAGPLVELLQGELFMTPSPTIEHQRIVGRISHWIKSLSESSVTGELLTGPVDVKFSEEDVVIPNLLFITNDNKGIILEKWIDGAPDLVIEVLSSNREHDLVRKRDLYQEYKVNEYWIIDPQEREFLLLKLEPSGYVETSTRVPGSSLYSEVMGTEIPWDIIFDEG